MKLLELSQIANLPGKQIKAHETFRFQCRAELACFNQCCRNLNLFLTPYDVMRLKNRLQINADRFIDRHVDIVLRKTDYFPEVLLRMNAAQQYACPFVDSSGCTVYTDRPETCRMFPVEQGAIYYAHQSRIELIHFFKPPDFCLGQHETKAWTPRQWSRYQDALEHNRMTLQWSQLRRRFLNDPWGPQGPQGQKAKMAFMATYNLDRFRDFVFQSTFLKRYRIKGSLRLKIKRDDAALLRFGIEWVEHFVWGRKSEAFKSK